MTTLPRGRKRVRRQEALFQHSMAGKEASGSHGSTFQSTMKETRIRGKLYAIVVPSGDTIMSPRVGERGYSLTTTAERAIVRGVKERLCHIRSGLTPR
jgi:hypothetical protein